MTLSFTKNEYLIPAILVTVFLFAYFESLYALLQFWWNSVSYDHGLLVGPISLYYGAKVIPSLLKTKANMNWIGIILLACVNFVWFLSYLADVRSLMLIAFWGVIVSLIYVYRGSKGIKIARFPLLFILIAFPIWDPLQLVLQAITVNVVKLWLDLSGIPIYVHANYIHIPEGQFLVETTCAGLRYFLAALALTSLYSKMNFRLTKTTAMFVVCSLAVVLVLNWVRVFVVIIAGHITNMQHYLVYDHANFGWWLFAIILIPIFYFGNVMARNESLKLAEN